MQPNSTWYANSRLFFHVTITKSNNQIPRSYKNDGFDWPFDLVIVTWKNNQIRNELEY